MTDIEDYCEEEEVLVVEEKELEETKEKTLNPIKDDEFATNIGEEQGKKLWTNVIKGNQISANAMTINFVAPSIVEGEIEVKIDEVDVESEVRF